MKIDLVWHADTEDIDLGHAYVEALPPIGSLVVYVPLDLPAPRPVCWKVVTLLIHPAMPGSWSARFAAGRTDEQFGMYQVFVEPAEGPYHAGEETTDG